MPDWGGRLLEENGSGELGGARRRHEGEKPVKITQQLERGSLPSDRTGRKQSERKSDGGD